MKMKRKLTSLLLMIAVVIALLPAVGAKNVKASDKGSYTLDLSEGKKVEVSGDSYLLYYISGATQVPAYRVLEYEDKSSESPKPMCYWLDLDKDNAADVEMTYDGSVFTFEKMATNSAKGEITIELKPEAKNGLDDTSKDYYSSVTFVMSKSGESASGHDKGNYTLDLSAGKKVESSDPALGSYMVFGMLTPEADVVDSILKTSTPQSWWIDLDRDGTTDVAFTLGSGVLEFEKRTTNSIKDQITIKLKAETISGLEFDAELGDSYYYSSVTFIMGKPAVKPGETKQTDTAVTAKTVKTTTGTYTVQNGEAAFTAPAKKTAKTVTIPTTITAGGKTVKVTAIAPNAFKGMKKLTTVTIGKNVETIGTKAFFKCKALKNIKIKTKKLTKKTIGSKAFTGISKKAVIKCPKAKKKAYKKIF